MYFRYRFRSVLVMRKRLIITAVVTLTLGIVVWLLVFQRADKYTVCQGIPADAVFIVETPSFNSIHDKLYGNKIWTSLKEYPYFEAYHTNLNLADSLCNAYPVLRKLLIVTLKHLAIANISISVTNR